MNAMSPLTRLTLASRLAPRLAPARIAAPAVGVAASRAVSSTPKKDKGAVDATKDTLKKVNRSVSDAALKGIETGEHARDKIKDTMGTGEAKSKEVKDQAAKRAEQGKDKAKQTYSDAKEKTAGGL